MKNNLTPQGMKSSTVIARKQEPSYSSGYSHL